MAFRLSLRVSAAVHSVEPQRGRLAKVLVERQGEKKEAQRPGEQLNGQVPRR